jgi:outer membrane protein insertion porin family
MQVDLGFTEPRFLDTNIAAGFDLFHKDVNLSSASAFRTRTTGGALRAGFPITENLWLTNSYNLTTSSIYDVDTLRASRAIREAEGDAITSSWGTSVAYDGRNHPKNPSSGFYWVTSGEFAGLGGDVQFYRLSGEGRYYYPITEKITFVSRVLGGYISAWGDQDLRLIDLFYKGGETIRGFNRGGFGPRDLNTGDALGGDTFWSATAEVRFPLPFIPEDIGLSGAAFADAGSLFGAGAFAKNPANAGCEAGNTNVICLADSSAVRASAGVSLIWNSPLGPLRLDVAKALKKESYDSEQLIRFGASTRF